MKSIEEIYQEMLAAFTERSGVELLAAGDLALRLYAMAAQVHSLWLQADWTQRQCFPRTAQGEYLDLHAEMRGLARRTATKAVGTLRFSVDSARESDLSIPAGTVCMTSGLIRFETIEPAVLAAGSFLVDVPAQAIETGSVCNVAAGTVTTMSVAPVGVARCTNPEAFSGGLDGEDDESLRTRVLDSYKRLPNGANAAFYEQGALSFEQVAAAAVLPRNRGVGTVDVIIASHAGMPDTDLLAQVQAYFEERREIAVDVNTLAPNELPVNISIAVTAAAGYEPAAVAAAAEEALRGYFDGKLLGQDILRAKLGNLVYAVEGVENYEITAPQSDVTVAQNELPVLGELAVSVL